MGFLKHLTAESERAKEVQAILRSNDIGKEKLLFDKGEANPQAMEELRGYITLMASANKQIVLHDMLEKRYSLRPYGWPDEEVLILLARLLVLGEISLMTDGGLVPLDKAFEVLTTPAKRRKSTVVKRQTSDPHALQQARGLGKELFHEMGPDGEDALFAFLHAKLKGWQLELSGWKPLADTGNYPGKEAIDESLGAIKKLLGCDNSFQFIEQFNSQKSDLLDVADAYMDLEQFYDHQKPTWEKLRKEFDRFQLNRLELQRDAQAGPALKRMQEILTAPGPYGMIKEADGLIATVAAVNVTLVDDARQKATAKLDQYLATLTSDLTVAGGDEQLRKACLSPIESLRRRIQSEESLPHITQAATEALKEYDAAGDRIQRAVEYAKKSGAKHCELAKEGDHNGEGDLQAVVEMLPQPVLKPKCIIRPAELVTAPYLESDADVESFLEQLRQQLTTAIANGKRIEIR